MHDMGTTHDLIVDDWLTAGTGPTPGWAPAGTGPTKDSLPGPGDSAVRVYSVLASLALGLVGVLGIHVLLGDPLASGWADPPAASAEVRGTP